MDRRSLSAARSRRATWGDPEPAIRISSKARCKYPPSSGRDDETHFAVPITVLALGLQRWPDPAGSLTLPVLKYYCGRSRPSPPTPMDQLGGRRSGTRPVRRLASSAP